MSFFEVVAQFINMIWHYFFSISFFNLPFSFGDFILGFIGVLLGISLIVFLFGGRNNG